MATTRATSRTRSVRRAGAVSEAQVVSKYSAKIKKEFNKMKPLMKKHKEMERIWVSDENSLTHFRSALRRGGFDAEETAEIKEKVKKYKKEHDTAKKEWVRTGETIAAQSKVVKGILSEVYHKYGRECVLKILEKSMFDEIDRLEDNTVLSPVFHMITPSNLRWMYKN